MSFLHKGRDKVILDFICCWHQAELKSFLDLCLEVQVMPGQNLVWGRAHEWMSLESSISIRYSLPLKSP